MEAPAPMPINPKPKKGSARKAQARRAKARRDRQFGRTPDGRDFAAFVRRHTCLGALLRMDPCAGRIEACHLQGRGAHPGLSGVNNIWAGCTRHHRQQYRIPWSEREAYAARLGQEWTA